MANRFRAVSPAQAFAAKVRWLVGCLILIILVLTITLVAVVQKVEMNHSSTIDAAPVAAAQISVPTVEVLFTSRRVEEGEKFEHDALTSRSMNPDQVPKDAFQASAKSMVITKAAARNIDVNVPITPEMITEPRMGEGGDPRIPPGFVAVTIIVDSRTGVEGWARPGKRVNVNVIYTDKGQKAIATIAQGVKILSVAGKVESAPGQPPPQNAGTTVTLLVSADDARKIEISRASGELTLMLLGEGPITPPVGEVPKLNFNDVIGSHQIEPSRPHELPPPEGKLYMKDPASGKQVLWELRNKIWKPAESS